MHAATNLALDLLLPRSPSIRAKAMDEQAVHANPALYISACVLLVVAEGTLLGIATDASIDPGTALSDDRKRRTFARDILDPLCGSEGLRVAIWDLASHPAKQNEMQIALEKMLDLARTVGRCAKGTSKDQPPWLARSAAGFLFGALSDLFVAFSTSQTGNALAGYPIPLLAETGIVKEALSAALVPGIDNTIRNLARKTATDLVGTNNTFSLGLNLAPLLLADILEADKQLSSVPSRAEGVSLLEGSYYFSSDDSSPTRELPDSDTLVGLISCLSLRGALTSHATDLCFLYSQSRAPRLCHATVDALSKLPLESWSDKQTTVGVLLESMLRDLGQLGLSATTATPAAKPIEQKTNETDISLDYSADDLGLYDDHISSPTDESGNPRAALVSKLLYSTLAPNSRNVLISLISRVLLGTSGTNNWRVPETTWSGIKRALERGSQLSGDEGQLWTQARAEFHQLSKALGL